MMDNEVSGDDLGDYWQEAEGADNVRAKDSILMSRPRRDQHTSHQRLSSAKIDTRQSSVMKAKPRNGKLSKTIMRSIMTPVRRTSKSSSSNSSSSSSSHRGKRSRASVETYTSNQSTLMQLINRIARGGGEEPTVLWNTFGNAPLFSMTDHALYNQFLMRFVEVVIGTSVRVLNAQVDRQQTLLGDRALCVAWKDRIEVWIRRFYVKNAVSIKAHLPSLPEVLLLTRLFLDQVDEQAKATHEDLCLWVTNNRVDKLQEHFPTIREFYADVRALSSISSCNRWRCQYDEMHRHAEVNGTQRQANTTHGGSDTRNHPHPNQTSRQLSTTQTTDTTGPVAMLPGAGAASTSGSVVVPTPAPHGSGTQHHTTLSILATQRSYQCGSTGMHPGTGLETHLRMWQARFERLMRLSRQLLCQASTDLQFADVWVEDALAIRALTEGVAGAQKRLLAGGSHTESARASDLLDDRASRMKAEQEKRKARRLKWLGRTAKAVGGNINADQEGKCDEVDLAPDEENDRSVSLHNGPSVRDKKRTVLSTATRVYHWCTANLRTVTTRTCLVVSRNALQRATSQVRRALDRIMEIEPGSDEQVCLTKMIYQTAMGVSMREVFLQTHRSRTVATNPITVMNRSLSPNHITEIQAAFMGRKLRDLYTDPSFRYRDILDLCLWSYHMNIRTRIEWLKDYCLYGDGFQDKIPRSFEGSVMGRARTPMVALVAGQWCVLEGDDLLYLCETTLEACTLWMLLLWTKHSSITDTRMSATAALRWSFERDDQSLDTLWLTEERKQNWSDRLNPDQNHMVWKRAPGPIIA
jgi:hypothetical protein